MGRCETTQFGVIEYEDSAVVYFPAGLPAFEAETRFLLIEQTETAPVVFLQSLATPRLVFLAVPARFVDPSFQLQLGVEERAALGLAGTPDPVEGVDLLSLAILTVKPGAQITANLLAPVVIGARSRRAVQVIQLETGYAVDHPLAGVAPCL